MDHLLLADSAETAGEAVESSGNVIIFLKKGATLLIQKLPEYAGTLVFIAVIIFIGIIIVRVGRRVISSIIDKSAARIKINQNPGHVNTVRSLATSVFNYVVYFIIITVILSLLGVNVSSLLAVAGVGGVAISFGAQALVKDVISGLFLWMEGSYVVGEWVKINNITGEVESVAIRTTVVRDWHGNVFTIPNGDIRTFSNLSRGNKLASVEIRCPYEESQDRIVKILKEEMEKAAKEIDGLVETPKIMSIVSFETDCVLVRIDALCKVNKHWWIGRELRTRVKNRFDKEGIVMPHYTKPPVM